MNKSFAVFAIKYATVDRLRKDNFLHPTDGDPESPMALDFFVWLVTAMPGFASWPMARPGHDPQVCLRYPSAGVPDVQAYRIA
jgi:hypothetical protein